MARKKKKKGKKDPSMVHLTKKCPKCYRYMELSLTKCPSCGARIGPVDEHGMAIEPVNWKAYLSAIGSCAAFVLFIWWAFFK